MASEAGGGAILVLTRIRLFDRAGLWEKQLNHAAGADRESRHEEDEGEAPHASCYSTFRSRARFACALRQF